MLRDTGEELQNRASTHSEGNLGAAVRTPQMQGWEESLRGRCKKERVRPDSPCPHAFRAPRAAARARAAGGSAALRTSGCCLVGAAARLWSPGCRRRRLRSWSQERRHRHGRHQRWAWGAGRRRAR